MTQSVANFPCFLPYSNYSYHYYLTTDCAFVNSLSHTIQDKCVTMTILVFCCYQLLTILITDLQPVVVEQSGRNLVNINIQGKPTIANM